MSKYKENEESTGEKSTSRREAIKLLAYTVPIVSSLVLSKEVAAQASCPAECPTHGCPPQCGVVCGTICPAV